MHRFWCNICYNVIYDVPFFSGFLKIFFFFFGLEEYTNFSLLFFGLFWCLSYLYPLRSWDLWCSVCHYFSENSQPLFFQIFVLPVLSFFSFWGSKYMYWYIRWLDIISQVLDDLFLFLKISLFFVCVTLSKFVDLFSSLLINSSIMPTYWYSCQRRSSFFLLFLFILAFSFDSFFF